MIKKNPIYRLTYVTPTDTVTVTMPLTCQFNITKSTYSESSRGSIQLYNLSETTRNIMYQALFLEMGVERHEIVFEAGYDGSMPVIFKGFVLQSYSHKSGGQTDIITEIQVQPYDIFGRDVSFAFEAGMSFKEAAKQIVSQMKNVTLENIGNLNGSFKTPTTFDGNAFSLLSKLTGGNCFIDNGSANIIMNNEVIEVPVPVVSDDSVLLETPVRKDNQLEVKMIFEPTLILGQLLEIKSRIAPIFNGQYKVIGFSHSGLFSPTQAGQRITNVTLALGPALPSSDIAITQGTEEGFATGAAAPVTDNSAPTQFNQVKGEDIQPVNFKEPSQIPEVDKYIKKYGRAPHTQITTNIYWDEVVRPNSLQYEKPSIEILTNLYYTAQYIQKFHDKYYPGKPILINSGWRSRGYNRTLKNAAPNSEHLYGNAIDFKISGYTARNVYYSTFQKYWKGRHYLHETYDFIHADITKKRGIVADW